MLSSSPSTIRSSPLNTWFIEWAGCCCSGSYIDKNIKIENGEEEKKMGSICRDEHKKHHIRFLACEALSHFPLFMPRYPGIHGEVVMSKSPKWLVNSGPGPKKKPVDETMVDLIISHCNTFFEPLPEQRLQFKIIPRAEESMSSGLNLSFEGGGGSSSVSNPSSETQNRFGNYPNGEIFREEQAPCLVMSKEENAMELKADKKLPKEIFKSKNLHSERKRRERINQGIYALRAVVPRITKMNKITID